jgi:RecB family exonuclease
MNCQQQVKFQETVPLAEPSIHSKTVFGTCIHDALEEYNKTGDVEDAKERFAVTWANPELLCDPPTYWTGTQYGSLMERGLQILDEYHDKQKWERRTVVATERKFCVPFGEHLLSGIVDLVEYKRSGTGRPTLRIVDYKSTSSKP